MKQTLRIAKTELQTLFYSPIAWFILVIFTVHIGMMYFNKLDYFTMQMEYDSTGYNNIVMLFTSYQFGGVFAVMLGYIFFYIPLLTMGVMSREYHSGSIKLLYASPLSNTQIVFGKYIALLVYSLILMGILLMFGIHGTILIENAYFPHVLTALLGIFFVICAYSAIGLFMSSLTSYQMVAALSTLVVLTFLSYVGGFWQHIPFVRDVTYWLSINGRASTFVNGMLCSEDIIYFITIILFFVYLTILRLIFKREKKTKGQVFKYYGILFLSLFAVAYVSSRPALKSYADMTRFESNTLTKASQEIVNNIKGKLTLTNYTNVLDESSNVYSASPQTELNDIDFYSMYTRFKPDIKLKYKYFESQKVANYERIVKWNKEKTHEEIVEDMAKRIKLSPKRIMTEEETMNFVDLPNESYTSIKVAELENGKKEYIRYFGGNDPRPTEANISASLKRLYETNMPKVGFIIGHGSRDKDKWGNDNYSAFISKKGKSSLYNQGFDVVDVDISKPVPTDINILVFPDLREELTAEEMKNYQAYVDRGDNLFILGEARRNEVSNKLIEQFGVRLADGVLVQPVKGYAADLLFTVATNESPSISYFFDKLYERRRYNKIGTASSTAIEIIADNGFRKVPMIVVDTVGGGAWTEIEDRYFEEKEPVLNPSVGEIRKAGTPVVMALDREHNGNTQKIMIFSDADIISNGGLNPYLYPDRTTANGTLIYGTFEWLSDGKGPIDMRRPEPIDNKYKLLKPGTQANKIIFLWLLPALMIVFALILTIKRKSK